MDLIQAYPALIAPFPVELLQIKPTAVTNDRTRALALPYIDMRPYQQRLDDIVTPAGWSVRYRSEGTAIICTLTICGISKEDIGEEDARDENAYTARVAQAFKRACSAFGLGRYLYDLPKAWADYDDRSKRFKNPEKVTQHLYRLAGILPEHQRSPGSNHAGSLPEHQPSAGSSNHAGFLPEHHPAAAIPNRRSVDDKARQKLWPAHR